MTGKEQQVEGRKVLRPSVQSACGGLTWDVLVPEDLLVGGPEPQITATFAR